MKCDINIVVCIGIKSGNSSEIEGKGRRLSGGALNFRPLEVLSPSNTYINHECVFHVEKFIHVNSFMESKVIKFV
jgi:hypothetical protein